MFVHMDVCTSQVHVGTCRCVCTSLFVKVVPSRYMLVDAGVHMDVTLYADVDMFVTLYTWMFVRRYM